MKDRVLGIISLLTNLALAGLAIFGVVCLFVPIMGPTPAQPFFYFTILSNCFAGVLAVIAVFLYFATIAKNKTVVPMWFQVLKLMSVVCLGITILTAFLYLLPTTGDANAVFGGVNMFFHLIIPILGAASYGFFEIHNKMKWRYTFLALLPVIAYIAFYAIYHFVNKGTGVATDWYNFGLKDENWVKVTFAGLIIIGVTYGLSFALWLLNKLSHLIVYGYEYHDEDIPETAMYSAEIVEQQEEETKEAEAEEAKEQEKVEEKPEEVKEEPTPVKEEASKEEKKAPKAKKAVSATYGKYDGKVRVYHISRSKFIGGQWQVKLAGGDKAIKLFLTQKEAIDYAKKLVRTQGGSIRIHSMKGQMRK